MKPIEYEPLDAEVLQDVCPKLKITTGKEECRVGDLLYEFNLFDIFIRISKEGYLSTLDEWELYFNEYLWYCGNPVFPKEGKEYYRCLYDFQEGESFDVLAVYFYVDGNTMDVDKSGGN